MEGDGDQMKMVIDQVGQIVVLPQDAAFRPPGAENGTVLIASVDVVEHLGSELLVYLARLDPRSDAQTVGQVMLYVDNAHMHLFDSGTGEAIFYKQLSCSRVER